VGNELYDSKCDTASSKSYKTHIWISCLCLAGVNIGTDPTTQWPCCPATAVRPQAQTQSVWESGRAQEGHTRSSVTNQLWSDATQYFV